MSVITKGQPSKQKSVLTDELLDKIIGYLRGLGYVYGVKKGNTICRVALHDSDNQIAFQKDNVQVLLFEENKKYKVEIEDCVINTETGKIEIDLSKSTEIVI